MLRGWLLKAVVEQGLLLLQELLLRELLHGEAIALLLYIGRSLAWVALRPLAVLRHPSPGWHDHWLLLLDQLSPSSVVVGEPPASSPDDGGRSLGKAPLLALAVRILPPGGFPPAAGAQNVPQPLSVLRLQQDEEDGVEEHRDVDHAVQGHLGLDARPSWHVPCPHVASVTKLVAVHLHQLVDIMRRPAHNEQDNKENHDDGGAIVRGVKLGRPCPTKLHEESDEGEDKKDEGHNEAAHQEGEQDILGVAVIKGAAHVMGAGYGVPHLTSAAVVHGGHGPGGHPDTQAQHPGQGDRPLVHLAGLATLGQVLAVVEVEEEGAKQEGVCVDTFEAVVSKHEELAEKFWEFPGHPGPMRVDDKGNGKEADGNVHHGNGQEEEVACSVKVGALLDNEAEEDVTQQGATEDGEVQDDVGPAEIRD